MGEKQFIQTLYNDYQKTNLIPGPALMCDWLTHLKELLFPPLANNHKISQHEFYETYQRSKSQLRQIIEAFDDLEGHQPKVLVCDYYDQLPSIRTQLYDDAQAILEGDPAAVSLTEVIRTYPGFMAIVHHRLAHLFYRMGVPIIPRILSEEAHRHTGIDIHPGAQIGSSFCIDHGTGIVIGETCRIGRDVKIYQGVTLGALSVEKKLAATKRHPTIEHGVVIYANATILGGDTCIGHHSIIGGNVWIVESVPPNSLIYFDNQQSKNKGIKK